MIQDLLAAGSSISPMAVPPCRQGSCDFFELIGIPLIGSYGSTECGGVTLCGIGDTKPGSLGKPFPNCELRIAEDGELLVRGTDGNARLF